MLYRHTYIFSTFFFQSIIYSVYLVLKRSTKFCPSVIHAMDFYGTAIKPMAAVKQVFNLNGYTL